jgi:hypothetical protein
MRRLARRLILTVNLKYREIPSYEGAAFAPGCFACIQSAAACALVAAVKIARGSFFITLSQEAM